MCNFDLKICINEESIDYLMLYNYYYYNRYTVGKFYRKGIAKSSAKVRKMKKVKKMMASVLVNVAKNNVKNDINSTGSDWIYQPKMPQGCEKFKKASK